MGSPSPAPLPLARLAGVGAVVFLANAVLLVLQLVASRLLAPFIGSELRTWTSIIGVFLSGIALGNAYGGRLADRYPSPRTLAWVLVLGAVAAAWMALFPTLLTQSEAHKVIPLGPRIPILTLALCLPAGFALSLLTPLAIKLGLPDVEKTGRVAGLVFALSTLGCLLGNYLTGFYLIPAFTINTLVLVAAGSLLALAAVTAVVFAADPTPAGGGEYANGAVHRDLKPADVVRPEESAPPPGGNGANASPFAFADIRRAYLVVFLASFGGMVLELTASRVLAITLGVSLYTWTGIIGVMLAGTAAGNLLGGLLADRANRPGSGRDPRDTLAATLGLASGAAVLVLAVLGPLSRSELFAKTELINRVLGTTFALFFLPMLLLGMVSPQVVRLAVRDAAHAGRAAGRVYAWSTAGAIAGTFAAGYVLLSTLGAQRTILAVGLAVAGAGLLAAPVWRKNLLLYLYAVALGGVVGGLILFWNGRQPEEGEVAVEETNYYTIRVARDAVRDRYTGLVEYTRYLNLYLDQLLHSSVDPDDPTFIHYQHEHVQMELLRAARAHAPEPRVLVIGGGGYTFPRYAKTALPEAVVDVVEIDPGVTRVAYERLGLKPGLTNDFNMDGRQFVAERAAPGSYDLVVLDAVNDLSVPAHLLTQEFNDAVKRALKPDGVYLLTVIDSIEHGRLWKAAMATLRRTFPHVALVGPYELPPADEPDGDLNERATWYLKDRAWRENRAVWVLYASDKPLDLAAVRDAAARAAGYYPAAAAGGAALAGLVTPVGYTHPVPDARLAPFLKDDPGVILTDQYAPVDNLMADVFRRR